MAGAEPRPTSPLANPLFRGDAPEAGPYQARRDWPSTSLGNCQPFYDQSCPSPRHGQYKVEFSKNSTYQAGVCMRNWNTTGRRPRHGLIAAEAVTMEVRREPGEMPQTLAAEILDLSRQGARLRASAAVGEHEVLTICLSGAELALDLHLTGVVRWRKQEADGRWLYGCEFKDELPLETLGELFLCGILSARPVCSG